MEIAQELFDEMVEEAIGDLRKSGLGNDEIFHIIQELFGSRYSSKLCREV